MHSKYSIKSIAAKLSIQKEMVWNILSKFKMNIIKMKHKRMKRTKGTGRSIDRDKLQAIKDYWISPKRRPIRIKDIKDYLWQLNSHERPPRFDYFYGFFFKELKMSYKVLQKRNPVTMTHDSINLFMKQLQSRCCWDQMIMNSFVLMSLAFRQENRVCQSWTLVDYMDTI